jgi:preprotein translocase subunit SecE
MNHLTLLSFLAAAPPLKELLIGFLVILVVLAIIAGLIYAVETWVMKSEIPSQIKLVIGLVLIVLVLIWAINNFL